MKRILCILLAMLMVICLLPITVVAVSAVWNGTAASDYAGGSGTEENPYQIANGQQLAYFAQQVNAGTNCTGIYFALTDDIVLNDTTNWELWSDTNVPANSWTPIDSFSGTFDGNDHTISGMYSISPGGAAGLFASISSTSIIKNVGVIDSYANGSMDAGAIAGISEGIVLDCYNTGTVVGSSAGGIIGTATGGSVTNCWNSGSILGSYSAGGIAATSSISTSFERCHNEGQVTVEGEGGYAGGIVGYCDSISINNCYNSGRVSALLENGKAGGLIGQSDVCSIQDSYNAGIIAGGLNTTGLLVGVVFTPDTPFIDTYYLDDGSVLNAVGAFYRDLPPPSTQATYNYDPDGASPLTSTQMQDVSSFTGWDFKRVWGWAQVDVGPYPYAYPIFGPMPITLEVTTLGGAARFDKTAIRFAASFTIEDLASLGVGDIIDYGFRINGLKDGKLTSDKWIKLSAANEQEGFTGLELTDEIESAASLDQMISIIRGKGIKVYDYDYENVTFAIIINNLPSQSQDSLWVFEPYVTINATDISLGEIRYNSVNRILDGIASGVFVGEEGGTEQ